jgi:hypothetical protein
MASKEALCKADAKVLLAKALVMRRIRSGCTLTSTDSVDTMDNLDFMVQLMQQALDTYTEEQQRDEQMQAAFYLAYLYDATGQLDKRDACSEHFIYVYNAT